MAKPELGIKRACTACGARFYDLARDPIICPKCETTFNPAAQTRSSRTRSAPVKAVKPVAAAPAPVAEEPEAANDDDLGEVTVIEDVNEDSEDEAAIEDASELGEDKDDMIEVMDKVVESDEDVR